MKSTKTSNPGNQEMERSFLVKTMPPGWKKQPHVKISQGYLCTSKEIEVRLRDMEGKYILAIKTRSGSSRLEEEFDIDEQRFARLWPLTKGKRISKVGYEIPFQGKTVELDVFTGPHKGLIMAEIEFDDPREFKFFQFPDWFGREVSSDPKYSNIVLAEKQALPKR